jgi:hypothetical protein
MNRNLPAIIYTIKLKPFIHVLDENDNVVKTLEVSELPEYIKDTIKQRIDNDYRQIISQTVSIHFPVSSYQYNTNANAITIDFIVKPEEVQRRWIPYSKGSPEPQNQQELLTRVRDIISDQITKLYGDLGDDTWRSYGESNIYTDENNLRYDIDLKLLDIDSFFDTRDTPGSFQPTNMTIKMEDVQPTIEHENQNGGTEMYVKKYLKYKSKYLYLKNGR